MIVAPLVTFLLALLLVGRLVSVTQRRGHLDRPGPRSSHQLPTPTGGGLGFMLALWFTGALALLVPAWFGEPALPPEWRILLALAMPLTLVGLIDDWRGVPARYRLLLQVLIAVLFAWALGEQGTLPWWAWSGIVVALVWTMNAYNFMDGSNGMAGMQGLFSGILLSVVFWRADQSGLALAAACLTAACAGFLPWNIPQARIFMGDSGSVPLGFLIAGLCLLGAFTGALAWPTAILVLAVFHVDAGLTLLSRMRSGERWYTAHNRHVYQRLIAQGWSHGQVLLLYSAINLLIVAPGVMLGNINKQWSWWIASAVLVLLSGAWYVVSLKLGEEGS